MTEWMRWVGGATLLLAVSCGGSSGDGGGGAGGTGGSSASGGTGNVSGMGGTGGFNPAAVDKLDLLLMVDNSVGMADKQALLAAAVPRLVSRLVTPNCVIDEGGTRQVVGVADASGNCAQGVAEFKPVKDIHIGVVSSSLGAHGGDVCSDSTNPDLDGQARLAEAFLTWAPDQGGGADASALSASFSGQIEGAGETGCGYEASLEAWYRFLVEPLPPEVVKQEDGFVVAEGIDQTLLQQRRDFLRPDSAVAIVMLTDENDCSIKDGAEPGDLAVAGQGYFVTLTSPPPRASAACATDPNDPCCYTCPLGAPAGCPSSDAECSKGAFISTVDDKLNLRCWDQKRRFGVDWLYSTERYVRGLTEPCVVGRDGQAYGNGLFWDPTKHDLATVCTLFGGDPKVKGGLGAQHRNPGLIFLAGIVGVPWQLVATEQSQHDAEHLAFLSAGELQTNGVWPQITATGNTPPQDSHMQESMDPRPGLPDSSQPLADPIHGHEYVTSATQTGDLQYACIYQLPAARDCNGFPGGCVCGPGASPGVVQSAACYSGSDFDTTQRYAVAYPSLRQLTVLRDLGANAVVASVCAKNSDPALGVDNPNYGYNPAIDALVGRLSEVLPSP